MKNSAVIDFNENINRILENLYFNHASRANNVPGPAEFIITESGLKITTEDGVPLITEG